LLVEPGGERGIAERQDLSGEHASVGRPGLPIDTVATGTPWHLDG
jgi:hypothetical protein